MATFESSEQIMQREGYIVTVLHGDSMWPMVRCRKDPVMIRPLASVRKGKALPHDVVAYRKSDRYVVHRVLRVMPHHYVIRGDNCLMQEYVPHEDVIGIVTQWWRGGKEHHVTDSAYRFYVTLWLAIHPLVRFLKRLRLRLFNALRRLRLLCKV